MEAAAAVAVDAAGLAACDSEPIHIPGSIQPYGMLLALGPRGLPVLQASANCAALFGRPVEEVIGHFLGELLPMAESTVLASLEARVPDQGSLVLKRLHLGGGARDGVFHATAHRSDGSIILELEPAGPDGDADPLDRPAPRRQRLCRRAAGGRFRRGGGRGRGTPDAADHRLRPGPGLPFRRGRERHGRRRGPQRGPALLSRPAVPRLRHPAAGARALPPEPPAADPRRHLRPGADRAGAEPAQRPAARPQLRQPAQRVADPCRVHAQHGDGLLDVGLAALRRPALGADLVPQPEAPPGPAGGAHGGRPRGPDRLAADRGQGARPRQCPPDGAEGRRIAPARPHGGRGPLHRRAGLPSP